MEDSKRRSYINHLVNVYKIRGRKGIGIQQLHRELAEMNHGVDEKDRPIVLTGPEVAEIVHHAYYRSAWDWAELGGPRDKQDLARLLGRA